MDTKSFFEKLKLFVKQSENIARWKEWNTSKLPLIFLVFYYLIAINKDFSYTSLLSFFNFFAFVCLYASFGYMINDFSDREVDKKAGKPKAIAQISPRAAKLVLFSIFLLGVLISLPFWLHNTYFLILLIVMYLLGTFYSLPPKTFADYANEGWRMADGCFFHRRSIYRLQYCIWIRSADYCNCARSSF